MDEINYDDFRTAGKIASKIRKESENLVMPGGSLLDVAETIEGMIAEEGYKPAFPVNICINSIAAHYTPEANSDIVFGDDDIVKVDFGVNVNDGLSDNAYTIDLSEKHEKLLDASRKALDAALKFIKPGVKVGDVGGVIEETIKADGFKPISNLTGHMLRPGILHAGIDVPNVKTEDPYEFQEGDIFAIEPFATDGKGYVNDTDQVEIFSLYMPGQVRMRESRRILTHILNEYGLLPFAERWLHKECKSKLLLKNALKEMLRMQMLKAYPVLKEAEGGLVSQFEHTIIITADGVEVTTK